MSIAPEQEGCCKQSRTETRAQSANFAQKYDAELVREMIRPIVRDEIRVKEVCRCAAACADLST